MVHKGQHQSMQLGQIYFLTTVLHSTLSFAHSRAASTVNPSKSSATFLPSIHIWFYTESLSTYCRPHYVMPCAAHPFIHLLSTSLCYAVRCSSIHPLTVDLIMLCRALLIHSSTYCRPHYVMPCVAHPFIHLLSTSLRYAVRRSSIHPLTVDLITLCRAPLIHSSKPILWSSPNEKLNLTKVLYKQLCNTKYYIKSSIYKVNIKY